MQNLCTADHYTERDIHEIIEMDEQLQDYNLFTEDFEDLKFFVNIGHNRLLATITPSSL